MIDLIFYYGTELVFIRVRESHIVFSVGSQIDKGSSTIEGLRLDKKGVTKEFPDLKDNPLWKEEAIKRFKQKIGEMKDEDDIANYLINDLQKYGYIPKWYQRAGYRRQKL